MSTIIIIQARMGSTRLPGKVLMSLGNTTVLDYVVKRCQLIKGVDQVIVATTQLATDDLIENWCRDNNVACFRGSENDVLSRYYYCASQYNPQYVIRVTSDCPFVDYELASSALDTMLKNPSEVLVFEGNLPRGLAVEIISFEALERMHLEGLEPRYREHVTYYAYEYPEKFKTTTFFLEDEYNYPKLRITLDTPEDYNLCKKLSYNVENSLFSSSKNIIKYLNEHPEVAAINEHIKQKPVV
ncbi:cytidylyltransferase domain-containing protein [Paenibacillus lentus]|uniref:cytidylyltransferase domain-containing protein n=1 Tax=Paenibacillus lentus TaxID=1338368 RepID=UPI003666F876